MSDKVWHVAVGGQQQGPFSLSELLPRFQSGELKADTHVFTQGMSEWALASARPEFAAVLGGPSAAPPAMPVASAASGAATMAPAGQRADEIDYEIFGEEMQFVEVTLDPQEACIAEAGAFMYKDGSIQMETVFGDGSGQQEGGLMGMVLGAAKRKLVGESLFMTIFGNTGGQRQKVAFASPYPGRIIAGDLRQYGGTLLCQKDAFLCGAKGVSVDIALQKKLGAGLFGGEGFILQKLTGDGMVFFHAGGTVVERTLAAGEVLHLDTGCMVALEQTINYDIQPIPGVKSWFFGGEGVFFAKLTGPGKVWVQSLPFRRLARRIYAAAPQTRGKGQGEGSLLGGIGDLVMGD